MHYQSKVYTVLFAALLLFLASAPHADAHARNQSYIYFDVTDGALSGRLEVTFGDLSKVLDLDNDRDGTITEAEILGQREIIYNYFLAERFILENGAERLQVVPTEIEFLDVEWETFALLRFDVPGLSRVPDEITITYRFLFDDLEPFHLGFALLASNSRTGLEENEANFSLAFLSGAERQTLSLVAAPWYELVKHYAKAGLNHVRAGLDHLLLLVVLGVASAFRRSEFGDLEIRGLRSGALTGLTLVAALVTAQGAASIASMYGILPLPTPLVQGLNAASIAAAALTIAIPRLLPWLVGFAALFGLLHGLGYGHTIGPIDIEPNRKQLAAVWFSVGSGVAMLAVTIAAWIAASAVFRFVGFPAGVLRIGAVASAVLAIVWAEERVFDLMGDLAPNILAALGM